LPQPGDRIDVALLEDKTKKGGWKAKHEPSGLAGAIKNSDDVPPDKKPGDRIEVFLLSHQPQFAYPTPEEEQRVQKSKRSKPV